ncbi:hypothetical protein WG66_003638 [Moniliophthora roreri]|nr:hypothetical protein WG66_003638 [Moniliophthora roreri]
MILYLSDRLSLETVFGCPLAFGLCLKERVRDHTSILIVNVLSSYSPKAPNDLQVCPEKSILK